MREFPFANSQFAGLNAGASSPQLWAEKGDAVADLDFRVQRQEQNNWCWAAVASSLARFYDASSVWKQCKVVNTQNPHSNCCIAPGACDRDGRLDLALQQTGNFHKWQRGHADGTLLKQELDASRPIAVRIAWSGGGGHFAVISDYDPVEDRVTVHDPHYGTQHLDYATFVFNYQGSGTWNGSYLTKI